MNVSIPIRWIVTLGLVAVVIVLSTIPGNTEVGDSAFVWLVVTTPTLLQKFMHFSIYGTMTVLWVWTLERVNRRSTRLLIAAILSIGLGAGLEWYQTSVPGRFGTLMDVLLNSVGAIVGLLIAIFLL